MQINTDCPFLKNGKCTVLYETHCDCCVIQIKMDHVKPCQPSIGGRINRLRLALGISLTNLASQAGVSVQSIKKWQNGTHPPHCTDIGRLAEIFGTTCDFILFGEKKYADPDMPPLDSIGERIAFMRVERMIPQRKFCKMIEKPQSTLLLWEHCQTYPLATDVIKLCDALQVPGDWLINGGNRNLLQQPRRHRHG